MTTEEKAKAYDEALRCAVIYYKEGNEDMKMMMKTCFPALVEESEDEKIRKEIIAVFKGQTSFTSKENNKKYIAWLEKQSEQKPIIDVPSREVILAIWDLGNEWKELTNGSISTEYGTQLDYIQKHWQESEYYLRAMQGEQKPIDKVEPKFKVGDWIVHNTANFVFKVINVGYNGYEVINRENYKKTISFDNEDNYHLWSIQDAKDGDVLVTTFDEDNMILMYRSMCTTDTINVHCCLDNKFTRANLGVFDVEDVKPATKEQRDLLFQNMKEKGYEWDAEKKELKKINSYCQENCKGFQETGKCFADGDCKAKKEAEQKPAWSEEEEHYIRQLESMVREKWALSEKAQDEEAIKNMSNLAFFLKTLNPNKKPSDEEMKTLLRTEYEKGRADAIADMQGEWSEEDEAKLKSILFHIEDVENKDVIDWLKSLRPQNTWKPSDEQMRALTFACIKNADIDKSSIKALYDLKEQLKQL